MGSGGRGLLRPASELGPAYEATLDAETRRRGVHYTPAAVATELVGLALGHWERDHWERGHAERRPPSICDPSCGGGAFLLAALDSLVRRGIDPTTALGCVYGIDSDPGAIDVCRSALRSWGAEHGRDVARAADRATDGTDGADAHLVVGDGLLGDWPHAPFDLVVGNPPFQSQLRSLTARDPAMRARVRELFTDAAVGYVDTAALFLLAALRHIASDGVVCLIQPRSTASATHAAEVRRRIAEAGVVELWWPERRLFDADVDVWAPVISLGSHADGGPAAGLATQLRGPDGWSDAVATRRGVPDLVLDPADVGPLISEVATVSAGFRDEFYGLIPYVVEAPEDRGPDHRASEAASIGRLVTVGAIEPLRCTWGERPVRFAGRRWDRPVVIAAAADDEVIGAWVRQQARPKVLVATQTRWVEAVADPDGALIGVTPAISVVPHPDGTPAASATSATSIGVEHLAVALSSPVITLLAHRRHGGTALVTDAVRLSAAAVRSLPLPGDRAAWDRAVELSTAWPLRWEELGEMMCAAYGVDREPVMEWWSALAPRSSGNPGISGSAGTAGREGKGV